MKKFLFTISALIAFGVSALAADVFEVADVYILPASGSQANIVVNYSLDAESSCGGYDFKITLPAGIAPIMDGDEITYTLGDCYKKAPSVVTGCSGSVLEVHVACGDPLTKQSGTLITIPVKATSALAIGKLAAQLHNADFIDYTTTYANAAADVDFDFIVSSTVVLDETSTVLPLTQNGVDILVKRKIKKDVWNTICLPFAMTEGQVKSIFGDDVKVAEFDSYQKDGNSISVAFTTADLAGEGFSENWPYIIKTSVDIDEFNLNGVDVKPDEDCEAQYNIGTPKKPNIIGSFYGTLKAGTIIPADNLFISGNKFYYSIGSTTIKGFRGYFWLKDFDSSALAPEINIVIDGNTTNINEIHGLFEEGAFYDMKGMKIENPTKKGVYIQNGKKVVVK